MMSGSTRLFILAQTPDGRPALAASVSASIRSQRCARMLSGDMVMRSSRSGSTSGDVIEQLRRIASRARIGGEEAEVGIDARGDRMIIAGAEMAIGAITLPRSEENSLNSST